MKGNPDMPRAAAEYPLRRMRASRSAFNMIEQEFADVVVASVLAELTPEVAAERWLMAQDHRLMMRRQLLARGCASVPDFLWPFGKHHVLGAVQRDVGAHVLHDDPRLSDSRPSDKYAAPPQVTTIHRGKDGRWMIRARYDLLHQMNVGMNISGCVKPGAASQSGGSSASFVSVTASS